MRNVRQDNQVHDVITKIIEMKNESKSFTIGKIIRQKNISQNTQLQQIIRKITALKNENEDNKFEYIMRKNTIEISMSKKNIHQDPHL